MSLGAVLHRLARFILAILVSGPAVLLLDPGFALADACTYPTKQPKPLLPADPELCRTFDPVVRNPSGLPQRAYQLKLQVYLDGFCHRDKKAGWVRDKFVRDTGPSTAQLSQGIWQNSYHGTHAPVVIWYSPEMYTWMKQNRTASDEDKKSDTSAVPDGAIMVKEMYPAPGSVCREVTPEYLLPITQGAAIMVRDAKASHDGWYWGWFGWSGWQPDYPAEKPKALTNMGFAQYCLNCHSSARGNQTFAALKNIENEPGRPLVYLSAHENPVPGAAGKHREKTSSSTGPPRRTVGLDAYNPAFQAAFKLKDGAPAPSEATVSKMPPQNYDHTFVSAGGPTIHDEYLTSSQCLGCHDAGSTGLSFEMAIPVAPDDPAARGDQMWNHSPYATWRTSPMGLAGRDPIFFSQLASETQSFHPGISKVVENTCLGCHGILGQRQFAIDHFAKSGPDAGSVEERCGAFTREKLDSVPWPEHKSANPRLADAKHGALARDGISCLSCHRMVLGEAASARAAAQEQNDCVIARQEFLNPGLQGFAKTFTGSFLVDGPTNIYGPFKEPKATPMRDALGNTPAHSSTISMSQTCGTCHTVHLPVFHKGKQIGHVYEQLTFPEWAFSAYRTGISPDGPLPEGAGQRAKSCQDCHMPSVDPDGSPTRSRIASIQEYSNFPQAEFTRAPDEIDLPIREGFSRHTLVGLNIFLTKMAQQFPDVLGIGTQDPMMGKRGIDPLIYTERKMLDQAANATVKISVPSVRVDNDKGTLNADVRVVNHVGHKFPSGVGFRRAFISFEVMDQGGEVIWSSGGTDGVGRIVGDDGKPLAGEMWWTADCAKRLEPNKRIHQPHYQTISRQDQVQIYQELVSAPADIGSPQCGHGAPPQGALTTSFLSICAEVKDNRLLPHGYLPLEKRIAIARALGAKADMAEDSGPTAVGNDPDYADGKGGGDTLNYAIPLSDLKGEPAQVRARMWYQATPPFYLQDRFCTARGNDTSRLYYLAGHLNLDNSPADNWKLLVGDTGPREIQP